MRPLAWGKTREGGFKGIWPRFHFYVFVPGVSKKSFGLTIKIRKSPHLWVHYQLILFERNRGRSDWIREQKDNQKRYERGQRRNPARQGKFIVRPTITIFELTRWHTKGDNKTRKGLKSYIRLKVCPGGKAISD